MATKMTTDEKIIKFGDKWLMHEWSTGSHPGDDYTKFQQEYRTLLRTIAKDANCELVKFNKKHYEFSAVLKRVDNGAYIYMNISDVRFWNGEWFTHILYRTMKNDHDWVGGPNHYCDLQVLAKCLDRIYD